MIVPAWQMAVVLGFACSAAAAARRIQRPASLGSMVFWILVAYGSTNIETASSGITVSYTEPAWSIVAFVMFGAGIVFFGESFVSSDDEDPTDGTAIEDLNIGGTS